MIKKKAGKPSPARTAARKSPAPTKAAAGAKRAAKPVAEIPESRTPTAKTAASKTAAGKAAASKSTTTKPAAGKPAAKRAPPPAGDQLEAFIIAAAATLVLPVEPEWLPAIKSNLDVTLRLGAQVAEFELPDEAEPAPVFGA